MIPRPLTVLHVDSAREYRGGQNQVRLLMTGLCKRGDVRQTLLASRGSRLAREASETGVPVREVRWRGAIDRHALKALLRAFSEDWDVVHAHDGHAVQSALLARAAGGGRSPVIASRRVEFAPRNAGTWARTDLVIAVSHHVREVLLGAGLERRRIEVVHSGIDPAEVSDPSGDGDRQVRAAAAANEEELLVAAVGELSAEKGHDTFVRASALLRESRPRVRFAIYGDGPEREPLQRLVRELRLTERFRLPGPVPDIASGLGGIDVFVMPSRREGLGTACIEAMLAGRPVVATAAGGLGELGSAGAFRPLPPDDVDALAREIARLLDDEDARRRAGSAAAEAGRRFTSATMVRRTVACYRAVGRS